MTNPNVFKKIPLTMFILYLATALVALTTLNYKKILWHAHAATLSRLQPPYGPLASFASGDGVCGRKQFEEYRLFFSQLVRIIGQRPDGYGMLAYCEYHLGRTDRAIWDFKKALEQAPYFIWFNYDLGFIYFQKGDYENASKYLSEAVKSNVDTVMRFMLASKLYMDAITSVKGLDKKLADGLREGMRDSYKMLVLSYFKQKRFNELIVIADVAVNQKLDDDGFFYYYLGVGAYSSNQYERAALYLREALDRNPESPESYYYLAIALKALNKEDLAVPALQKAEILAKARGPSYEKIKNLRLRLF